MSITERQCNPFATAGRIVSGDRFFGRRPDLRAIESRLLPTHLVGSNVAIVGQLHVGKSSLVHQAIMERAAALRAQRVLPCWINVGRFENRVSFFQELVRSCADTLQEMDGLTPRLDAAAQSIFSYQGEWTSFSKAVDRFFIRVHREQYRVIFILDELDYARTVFQGDTSAWQALRDLGYLPECGVSYVSTSRRSISDIETQSGGISNLDQIFHSHILSLFPEADWDEYACRLRDAGVEVTPERRRKIEYYCGAHPYLLALLGAEIVSRYQAGEAVDVGLAFGAIRHMVVRYYEKTVALLKEDKKYDKLAQILFGPLIDVRQPDVDSLEDYGLIRASDASDGYTAYSGHFQSYLQLIEREVDLWPLWCETERALRRMIASVYQQYYGDADWFEALERDHPCLAGPKPGGRSLFQDARQAQARERRQWGARASPDVLDYTQPGDLFAMVETSWRLFEPVLRDTEEVWRSRFADLRSIRNPLAHNRATGIDEHLRRAAEDYCRLILRLTADMP